MFGEKSCPLQIYLLATSTTGFWTVIDGRERIAVTLVCQEWAVSPVIHTGPC